MELPNASFSPKTSLQYDNTFGFFHVFKVWYNLKNEQNTVRFWVKKTCSEPPFLHYFVCSLDYIKLWKRRKNAKSCPIVEGGQNSKGFVRKLHFCIILFVFWMIWNFETLKTKTLSYQRNSLSNPPLTFRIGEADPKDPNGKVKGAK